MLKLAVGYLHLLATCLALGSVLVADYRLYRGRMYPIRQGSLSRLVATSKVVLFSLVVLWITGPLLVWLSYAADPSNFAVSGKLWAKLTVVTVLTGNGVLLHVLAFPRLGRDAVLMQKPIHERCALAVLGAISCVSWLFASLLGMARAWNVGVSYQSIMLPYSVLLLLAAIFAVALFAGRPAFGRAVASATPNLMPHRLQSGQLVLRRSQNNR